MITLMRVFRIRLRFPFAARRHRLDDLVGTAPRLKPFARGKHDRW